MIMWYPLSIRLSLNFLFIYLVGHCATHNKLSHVDNVVDDPLEGSDGTDSSRASYHRGDPLVTLLRDRVFEIDEGHKRMEDW